MIGSDIPEASHYQLMKASTWSVKAASESIKHAQQAYPKNRAVVNFHQLEA
jgi:hypothetical protein